jgi:hypothetical protein
MAAGDILFRRGSRIILRDTAGGADVYQWAVKNTAAGAGRVSPVIDLGADAKPGLYKIRLRNKFAVAPTAKLGVEWFLAEWHSDTPGDPDAELPAVDTGYAAGAAGLQKIDHLTFLRAIGAETAAVGPFSGSVTVFIVQRHISLMLINRTNQGLADEDDVNMAIFTPAYAQVQS